MNLAAVADFIAATGALGLALVVIWALMTERLVPRARLDDLDRERAAILDELRAIADAVRREP